MLTMISLLAMTSEKPKHHVEKTRLPAPYFANLLLRKRPASLRALAAEIARRQQKFCASAPQLCVAFGAAAAQF